LSPNGHKLAKVDKKLRVCENELFSFARGGPTVSPRFPYLIRDKYWVRRGNSLFWHIIFIGVFFFPLPSYRCVETVKWSGRCQLTLNNMPLKLLIATMLCGRWNTAFLPTILPCGQTIRKWMRSSDFDYILARASWKRSNS